MGSPVRRFVQARLRTVLVVSGAAAAVLVLGAFALVNNGKGAGSAKSAQTQTAPEATAPLGDGSRSRPPRASRGKPRSPVPSPTKTKSPKKRETSRKKADTEAGYVAKPEPKKKKKKRSEVVESGSCEASYYWEGQMTASGEPFDPSKLTAAHKTLPMGSKVRVTNKNNDRSVVVRINDRGPFVSGRCLDLSRAAMKEIGGTAAGVIPVRYEVLSRG